MHLARRTLGLITQSFLIPDARIEIEKVRDEHIPIAAMASPTAMCQPRLTMVRLRCSRSCSHLGARKCRWQLLRRQEA